MCSAFSDWGSVQGHKESCGETLLGVIISASGDAFSILQLCRVFTGAVHSRALLLVATSCQGMLVRRREIQFPAQPDLTNLCFWHPFQPSRGDSQARDAFHRNLLYNEVVQGLLRVFSLGKSRFLFSLKLSVQIVFICSFSSLTSCSFNITTLWHLLGGLYPSSCWQPSSFQYVITEQGAFLKENKQMSRLHLLLGQQVPGNKHCVSKGTLSSSAGNFSIQASVVSHKSFCFTRDRRAQSCVISWARHEWAGDYSGVSGSGQLWGLRTP